MWFLMTSAWNGVNGVAWQLGRPAEAVREFQAALDRREAPDPYVRLCLQALGGE